MNHRLRVTGRRVKPRGRFAKWLANESGLTMLELVVAIIVVGLISVTFVPFFKVNLTSYIRIHLGKNALQSSRIAFDVMMNDIKQITSVNDIDYASSSRIDVDVPNDGLGAITYSYSSSDQILYREGVKLAESVLSFSIRYYKNDGTEFNPGGWSPDIWRIEVEMSIGDSDYNLDLKQSVSPRNLHI